MDAVRRVLRAATALPEEQRWEVVSRLLYALLGEGFDREVVVQNPHDGSPYAAVIPALWMELEREVGAETGPTVPSGRVVSLIASGTDLKTIADRLEELGSS
jgi:hypothetical protein